MDFLHKSSFYNYLTGVSYKPTQKSRFVANILTFYFLLFFYTFGTVFTLSISSAICAFIGAILFIAGAQLGLFRNIKPNLATLMPISYKRRIVYDFLGAIVCTVIAILLFCLVVLFGVILGIIIAAISGDVSANEEDAEIAVTIFRSVGAYGGVFCAVYCLITYSAGLLSSYFRRRKNRNIFLLCFVIAMGLGTTFSGLPYAMHSPEATGRFKTMLPFVDECYRYMSAPWLCTLLWCLVAAGMLAAAIYMSYRYHKPKAF